MKETTSDNAKGKPSNLVPLHLRLRRHLTSSDIVVKY